MRRDDEENVAFTGHTGEQKENREIESDTHMDFVYMGYKCRMVGLLRKQTLLSFKKKR